MTLHDRFNCGRWRLQAARNHNDIRASQGGQRLAQPPRWKDLPSAKGIRGIQHHDIGVSPQPKMLESIVEDEPLHPVLSEDRSVLE